VSLGFTETYLTLLNSGADTEKLDFIDNNKYAISSLSASAQVKVLDYLADENAVINQKQPETFSLLSKLNILEETSALFLNEVQEKQLLNYIMDNKVSAGLTHAYLDLVSAESEFEKLIYLENNKYLISSYDQNFQGTLLEYLVDKEDKSELDLVYASNLSNFIQKGDSEKIVVLESSRGLGLGLDGEQKFFSYLADNKLSADFAKAYLDLFTDEAGSDKYAFLENNKYSVTDLSQINQDRFFNYLVDPEDKLNEDLLFAKILVNLAQQGAVSKINALDSGFELDLDSQQEKQFLRYLLNSKLSAGIAVGYAELASADIASPLLSILLDPKKLELLKSKRTDIENSLQVLEANRNSTNYSTGMDSYIERQIDEILASRVSLNVF
jgi:hypothetical protein